MREFSQLTIDESIEYLSIQLDKCSDEHNSCNSCDRLQQCRDLWDKLAANSDNSLAAHLLEEYLAEFKTLRSREHADQFENAAAQGR